MAASLRRCMKGLAAQQIRREHRFRVPVQTPPQGPVSLSKSTEKSLLAEVLANMSLPGGLSHLCWRLDQSLK